MRTRFAAAGVAVLALMFGTGSAQAQHPHTQAVKAVGTYDVQVEMQGQAQSTVLTIAQEKEGKLGGTLAIHGQEFKVESVTLRGHDLIVRAVMQHGVLTMTLTFKSADEVTGTFEMEGMGTGNLSGTRRKA